MRKGILWTLLVLVVVVLFLPIGMGLLARNQFNEIVNSIRERKGIEINVEKYQIRWFASKAYLNVSVPDLEKIGIDFNNNQKNDNETLNLMVDIYHGPIILSNYRVYVGQNYSKIYKLDNANQQIQNANPVNTDQSTINPIAKVFVYLNGQVHTNINLPTTTFTMDLANGQVISQGLEGDWYFSTNLNTVKANMTIKQATFELPEHHLKTTMKPLTLSYRINDSHRMQYKNKIDMKSPATEIDYDNKKMKIQNTHLIIKPTFEDNLLSSSVSLDLDTIRVNDINIGSINTSMSVKNLDTQSLSNIGKGIINLSQPGMNEQIRQILILNILTNIPGLLSHRVELEIDHFNFMMPEGDVKAQFYLQLPDSEDVVIFDLLSVVKDIEFEASLQLPIPVAKMLVASYLRSKYFLEQDKFIDQVQSIYIDLPEPTDQNIAGSPGQIMEKVNEQAREQLDKWVSQGIIKQTDQYYLFYIKLYEGELSLNDQTIMKLH